MEWISFFCGIATLIVVEMFVIGIFMLASGSND